MSQVTVDISGQVTVDETITQVQVTAPSTISIVQDGTDVTVTENVTPITILQDQINVDVNVSTTPVSVEIGTSFDGTPLFVQASQPTISSPYLWVDTSKAALTMWVQDGAA